ncbi:MAG: hypothetical protein WA364_21285 [Candidatus Nitrosopolaris sp.]
MVKTDRVWDVAEKSKRNFEPESTSSFAKNVDIHRKPGCDPVVVKA